MHPSHYVPQSSLIPDYVYVILSLSEHLQEHVSRNGRLKIDPLNQNVWSENFKLQRLDHL